MGSPAVFCLAGIMEFIALAVNDNFTCMPLSVAPKAGEPMSNAMMVSDVLLQRLSKESPIRCDAIPHLEDFTWSHYQFMGGQGGEEGRMNEWRRSLLSSPLQCICSLHDGKHDSINAGSSGLISSGELACMYAGALFLVARATVG
jgi:hypothetical protein